MTPSFPHRMLTTLARTALTLFEHLPPIIAAFVFLTCVTAVVITVVYVPWGLCLLIVRTERWIAQRVACHALGRLNREYAELCDSYSAEHLPGVTYLGRHASPSLRHAARRRRVPGVRIPGRPRMRRHTTTSSSDRRPR